jgi:hypothetical protein
MGEWKEFPFEQKNTDIQKTLMVHAWRAVTAGMSAFHGGYIPWCLEQFFVPDPHKLESLKLRFKVRNSTPKMQRNSENSHKK